MRIIHPDSSGLKPTRALTIESMPKGGFMVYDAGAHMHGFRNYLAAFSRLVDALEFLDTEMRASASAPTEA